MAIDFVPGSYTPASVSSKNAPAVIVTPLLEESEDEIYQGDLSPDIQHDCSSLEDVLSLVNYLRVAWIATLHRLNTDVGSQATQWGLISHNDVGDGGVEGDDRHYFPAFANDLDTEPDIAAFCDTLALDQSTRLVLESAWLSEAATLFFERDESNVIVSAHTDQDEIPIDNTLANVSDPRDVQSAPGLFATIMAIFMYRST